MRFLLFIFCITSSALNAQFLFDRNDSIPVRVGNDTLNMPWAGGLNYVQISDIDFDFDGDMDLFVFDRSKDNIRLFEQRNNPNPHYYPVSNAKNFFPNEIRYRVFLGDYNQDGKNDLFTYGIGGVKVYKNIGNSEQGLQWELATNLILSDYNGTKSNLYVSSSDIPAIIDVDFDGDLDILTFHIGGQRVEYHQNQSQELYGHSDSLTFVLKNECWGKFTEDANNNSVTLNDPNNPCSSGNIPNPEFPTIEPDSREERHAGSTLLALDYDHSGVYDLILGDVAHENLTLLINGGDEPNTNSAMISQDNNFPSNTTPVSMQLFPAAFYVDVDFDHVKDLIVGANAKGVSQNERSVYLYKNLGENDEPIFSFRSKNFLQGEMIDNGFASFPTFSDINNDGKPDLIVGNFYRYKEVLAKESTWSLYRNTGDFTNPFFTFVDSDFLTLSQQSWGLRTVPAFGDMDQDGDDDLFLGLENGTISYRENIASSGMPAQFASPINTFFDNQNQVISAGSYAFPQIFDLNQDGRNDLIIGKKTGEIMYYENVGTGGNVELELKNDQLGGIDLAPTNPEGFAAPHFFRWQDTTYLLLGGIDGKLRFYKGIDEHLELGDTFQLVTSSFRNIDVEAYSTCWVNDVDNDGKLNLFVGGDLGGIMHFEHNPFSTLSVEKWDDIEFQLYPNPSTGNFYILTEYGEKTIRIFDQTGKLILETGTIEPKIELSLSQQTSGMYFIQCVTPNGISTRKLLKL